jgi:DNA-binding response OmpR family regulator
MLNKKKIIAIFKKNFFLEELIVLLEDEGLKIKKVSDFHKLDKLISNKILLIDIDSKKKLGNVKNFLQNTVSNCNVFIIHNENLKIDIEDVLFLKPPIVFKELVNQLYKIREKDENLSNVVRLKYFHLNLKKNQLIFNKTNKILKLTELEGRFLKFLSENVKGSTKQELLSKVWGHSKLLDTHTLESLIYRLRKKIEVNPNEPKLLVLIEKKYFFIKN